MKHAILQKRKQYKTVKVMHKPSNLNDFNKFLLFSKQIQIWYKKFKQCENVYTFFITADSNLKLYFEFNFT